MPEETEPATSESASAEPAAEERARPEPAPAKKPRRHRGPLGWIRLFVLWVVVFVLVSVQAPVLPHVVRVVVKFEAWRKGVTVRIGGIEGSLFDPVVLRDSVWTYRSETGATVRVEVGRVRAWFAWSNIFPEPASRWIRAGALRAGFQPIGWDGYWFQRLELGGVAAKLSLPDGSETAVEAQARRWLRSAPGEGWMRAPRVLSIRDAEAAIERGGDWARAKGLRLLLSEVEPGAMRAAEVAWDVQGVAQSFRGVRGRTTLAAGQATFAGFDLGPDVRVKTFSALLSKLARGRLSFAADLEAFGGELSLTAETVPDGRDLRFDVSGNFDGVQLAALSRFLARHEAAGGILRRGSFTFRGSPRDFTRAVGEVRFDADNFQWDNRQFDALTLGASFMEQRVHLHEMKLHQGANRLELGGTMALPETGVPWWKWPFDLRVNADLRDLTGLAALLLPEFRFAAGQLFIRGTVNCTGHADGAAPRYGGQVILSGSGIRWRSAPLDVLNAALVFHERELQIINAQFLNGDDYLRGVGRISLAGDGAYDGVLRASVRDLALYQALLALPVLPFGVSGRAVVDWRGSGLRAEHEGRFSARLAEFGVTGTGGARPAHPLAATIEGGYAREQLQLEKFEMSAGGTSFSATVAVGPSAVNFRGIRLAHNDTVQLEGDALLPFDLWQRWPDVDIARLLNDDTVARVNLTARSLDISKASLLTGVAWPVAGRLNGGLTAEGALKSLQLGGALTLTDGRLPLNPRGSAVTEVAAEFSLAGSTISLVKAEGRHATGSFAVDGALKLDNARIPSVLAAGAGTNDGQPFSFRVTGPAAAPAITVEGTAPFAPAQSR